MATCAERTHLASDPWLVSLAPVPGVVCYRGCLFPKSRASGVLSTDLGTTAPAQCAMPEGGELGMMGSHRVIERMSL